MSRISERDRREFAAYLRNCTDSQVLGVLEKERGAGRRGYVRLAELEQARRDGRHGEHFANCHHSRPLF